ncbi:MAG: phage tail tape measure protein, partial [Candidatus Freyarchaeota archaeon]
MAEAGNIKVIFSAVTAQFDKAVSNIQKNLTSLEDKFQKIGAVGKTLTKTVTLPFLALGGAAFAAAAKLGYTADRILDLTEITGLSAKSIQEWQHVARVAGVEIEAVTDAIEGLVRRMPQLESEGGRSVEQLSKLGLTFQDIKAMTPDEAVDAIIAGLVKMEDTLERNAVGAALFGRAWEDIAPILGLGEKGIQEARREAEKLGLVLSDEALKSAVEFRIELDKLKAQLERTFLAFGQAALPVLQSLLNVIQNMLPAIQGLINAFASLPQWVQNSITAIMAFAAAIGPVMMGVSALAKAFTKLKPVLLLFQKVIPAVVAGFKALGVALSGLSLAAKAVSGVIGFLVVDFISGAIQAENFKRKIADLKEIMETSTDDAERYLAAVELWNKTESVEAMKV